MAVNYSIDASARIIRLELIGEITSEDWTRAMRSILKSPAYQPGFGVLADRRGAKPVTVALAEYLIGFMLVNREVLAGARWALVVADPPGFEMAQIGQTLAQTARLPIPIRIFDDVDAAERWLRLTAPEE